LLANYAEQTLKFLSKSIRVLNIPVLLEGGLLQEFYELFFFCGLPFTLALRGKRNCNAPRKNCIRESLG